MMFRELGEVIGWKYGPYGPYPIYAKTGPKPKAPKPEAPKPEAPKAPETPKAPKTGSVKKGPATDYRPDATFDEHFGKQGKFMKEHIFTTDPRIRADNSRPIPLHVTVGRHEADSTMGSGAVGCYFHDGSGISFRDTYVKDMRHGFHHAVQMYKDPAKNWYGGREPGWEHRARQTAVANAAHRFSTYYHEMAHEYDLCDKFHTGIRRTEFDGSWGKTSREFDEMYHNYYSECKRIGCDYMTPGGDRVNYDTMDRSLNPEAKSVYEGMQHHWRYATRDKFEFFAVAYETYMTRPDILESKCPKLYDLMKRRLNGYESPWKQWIKDGKMPGVST